MIEKIRKETLTKLRALSFEEKMSRSTLCVQNFIKSPIGLKLFSNLSQLKVAIYRSMIHEFQLSALENYLDQKGAKLFYPITADTHLKMIELGPKRPVHWKKDRLGFEVPDISISLSTSHQAKLDMIFVPGVAFGDGGERIGRGKGYYDRFLGTDPMARDAKRVALCFDFQLFPTLPEQSHDQRMDVVVSESKIVLRLSTPTVGS